MISMLNQWGWLCERQTWIDVEYKIQVIWGITNKDQMNKLVKKNETLFFGKLQSGESGGNI